jgi:hypothetical protein
MADTLCYASWDVADGTDGESVYQAAACLVFRGVVWEIVVVRCGTILLFRS